MGEGWGEGVKKVNALIILPPHPRLLPQGEGVRAFCDTPFKRPLSPWERVGVRELKNT